LNGTPIILTIPGNDADAAVGDLDVNADTNIVGNGPSNTIVQGAANGTYAGSIGDKVFGINQDGTHPRSHGELFWVSPSAMGIIRLRTRMHPLPIPAAVWTFIKLAPAT
jgi:hypothetical protein